MTDQPSMIARARDAGGRFIRAIDPEPAPTTDELTPDQFLDRLFAEIVAEAELSAGERLRRLDPELADAADAAFQRLLAEQAAETCRHDPVDWQQAQADLHEQRARLLLAGGNALDATLRIGELGVLVARQAAGIEAAARMALASAARQLPPPADSGGAGGGS